MEVYKRLGVQGVINASGRMTNLGGSAIAADVAQVMAQAGQDYVEIDELQLAVGREIAQLISSEDAMVTTGAAAGIALMVAACIAGTDLRRVQSLPDALDRPNEIVIQAGHQVNFGAPVNQMIAIGGGRPLPIGTVNNVLEQHLISALGPRTAAFLYVQSHHTVQKGMLPLDHCIEVCRAHNIPVLIDAAAEENLLRYTSSGAALIAFSGGKAIEGPTSGIVAGRADLIDACRAQRHGIGRPMKVGKEALVGLFKAVTMYMKRDADQERRCQSAIVDRLMDGFSSCSSASPTRLRDEAGRGIERAALQLDRQGAVELTTFLHSGTPPIHPRAHLTNLGVVAFDPRPLSIDDVDIIVRRVHEYFNQRQTDTTGT